jgi:type II secretory ATPase GspE/PulE/Tfp pilus assembly ATPase PilB-like protein
MTGFKGMTGVFEFLPVTNEIADLIYENASLSRIREAGRRYGYIPLFESGLEKVTKGEVTLEELLRETSNIEDYTFQPDRLTAEKTDVGTV